MQLIYGDCIEEMRKLPENSVDAIITDPPYELGFMGKSWDSTGIANSVEMWKECLRVLKPGGYLLSFGGTRTYHRMACAIEDAGFEVRDMIEWIYSTGFPKSHNVWKQLKKECDCGIMDEYERTKKIPKSLMRLMSETDISQTITNSKTEGEVLQSELSEQSISDERGLSKSLPLSERGTESSLERGSATETNPWELSRNDLSEMSEGISTNGEERRIHNATQISDGSTSEQATNENGSGASHRPQSEKQQDREPCAFCKQSGTQAIRTLGVGSALKPAHEPICLARKPLEKGLTVAENVLKYGTGGINIDESRVEYQSEADKSSATPQGKCTSNTSAGSAPDVDMSEVDYNGEKYWYKNEYKWLIDKWLNDEDYVWSELKENLETYNWCKVPEIDNGDRVLFDSQEGVCVRLYESKRKEFERPDQLGRFPANILHDNSEEVRECFPDSGGGLYSKSGGRNISGASRAFGDFDQSVKNAPDNYGDNGNASRFFKSIVYQAKASKSERNKGCEELEDKLFAQSGGAQQALRDGKTEYQKTSEASTGLNTVKITKNNHPTVKPIALMEYLIKMVTPAGGTVLDPFMGSGTTGVASVKTGYLFIGIEMDAGYMEIAKARINHVNQKLL